MINLNAFVDLKKISTGFSEQSSNLEPRASNTCNQILKNEGRAFYGRN
jgi:hypothetical protein